MKDYKTMTAAFEHVEPEPVGFEYYGQYFYLTGNDAALFRALKTMKGEETAIRKMLPYLGFRKEKTADVTAPTVQTLQAGK